MAYILFHLELVWAFVRGDEEALYKIDATVRGVLLSFLAIVITEPINLLYTVLFGDVDNMLIFSEGGLGLWIANTLLDWGLGPVVLYLICRFFGFRDRFIPLIVSYNWLSVIVLLLTLVPGAIVTSGLGGPGMAVLIMLGIILFALWISYRLFSFVLECPGSMALALAVLLMVANVAATVMLFQHSASTAM
ncbi:hypothetical protein SAMN04515647_2103 [Cohaesibacter sp. ES.047]|uniref:hypothetical protein n=1 Tax=Cohaesibacter sp. ES.047 TaxID=1798205 RepID=UPI000BB6B2E7|nr:hypothetical protein [Cohaesibacter sp. ES.047]SNY91859.1 hypothetical protein SAMN04515647_2103 [Cohaesibacter sp. ES.047]